MQMRLTLAALALATYAIPAAAQVQNTAAKPTAAEIKSANASAAAGLLVTLRDLDEVVDDKFEKSSEATSSIPINNAISHLKVGEPKKDGRQIGNVNLFLIRAHDLYRHIKQDSDCDDDADGDICTSLSDLDNLTHRLLSKRGLAWSMAAILRAGLMVGDSGDGAEKYFERSELVSKAFGAYYVDFELPHWGDGLAWFDGTVSGHFGYAPVAAVVRKRPDASDPAPKITALYMPGYTWGAAFRLNFQKFGKSEISGVVSTGAERLADLNIKLGADTKAAIGDVLRNDVGRWGWRHGFGVEYRYFGADLDFVHHDASRLLTPRLALAVSYQFAERFQPREDLAGFGKPGRFNSRISVNVVEWVRDTAKIGKSNDPLTVRVVFENDFPLRKEQPRVPSGTRLYVEANADLLKAFGFGEAK